MKLSCLILPLIFTFSLQGMLDYYSELTLVPEGYTLLAPATRSDESFEPEVSNALASAYYISLEDLKQEITSLAREILSKYPQWIEQFSKKVEEIIIFETPQRTSFTREEIVRLIHQYKEDFIQRKLFLEKSERPRIITPLVEPVIQQITTPSRIIAFRLYEYNKHRSHLKKFAGKYRLFEASTAEHFLQNSHTDRHRTIYIEDPHKAGFLVPEFEIETYKQYLAKIEPHHKKSRVKKLLRKLTCLPKSIPIPILVNNIVSHDIISGEDFIVNRQDALAIIEFCGIDLALSSEFLDTAQIRNPELCVNYELELYNVHILKNILEQTINNV